MGNGAGREGTLSAMDYLTNILASKVYDVAYESPLQLAPKLSERWGANVWLKREDLQPVCNLCACDFINLSSAFSISACLIKYGIDRILVFQYG